MADTFSFEEAQGAVPKLVPAQRTKRKDVTNIEIPEGSLLPSDPNVLSTLVNAAKKYSVPAPVLLAMAHQESSYRPDAVGPATKYGNAKGMFQYIDETANNLGIDAFDYAQAADAAAKQISQRLGKGIEWAIAAHHAGDDPKQHGPITERYMNEVLGKASVIAAELGENFQLPELTPEDLSGQTFSFEEALAGAPAAPAKAATKPKPVEPDEEPTLLESLSKAYEERFSPAAQLKTVVGSIKKGWEGLQEALNRETVLQDVPEELLQQRYKDFIKEQARSTAPQWLSLDQYRQQYGKVRVAAESTADREKRYNLMLQTGKIQPSELPKDLKHLDKTSLKGFIANFENPTKLILEDSLPANFITFLANAPVTERRQFDEARAAARQLDITKNPGKYSAEEVAAAKTALEERRRTQDPTIRETWDDLFQAATEDPGRFGATLVNSLMADPYLFAIPVGTAAKGLRTAEAVKGATIAARASRIANNILGAGSMEAAMNIAVGAGQNLATTGVVNPNEVKLNAALGYILTGAGSILGEVFTRGAKAKGTDLNKSKLDGTYEQILKDQAAADVAVENIVAGKTNLDRSTRNRIEQLLGIKSNAERDAWLKAWREQVRKQFKEESDYYDYQKFVADERMNAAAERAAALEARRTAEQAAAAEAASTQAARRAQFQSEYDKAIEARNAAESADLETQAKLEDQAITAARKINNEEALEAIFTADDPTIKQTMARINRREAGLRIPKWQRGSAQREMLAALGITAAAATAGASLFPEEPRKGALAGAILSGLGYGGLRGALGSRSRLGAPSRISQEGAFKPKGGNWTAGSEESLAPYDLGLLNPETGSAPALDQHAINATRRYLNKYAGTVDDPLKDLVLPDGTRWEDAMDEAIGQSILPNKYGELEYSFSAGPEIKPLVSGRDSSGFTAIRNYMDHVGDYLRTLPESEVAKMDFVRMVKETKRWDEANAKKAEKAQVKFFKDAEVLKEYDDGFKWIRLNKPGQFANESDLMGHSVRGYEPYPYYPGEVHRSGDPARYNPPQPAHEDWIPESIGGHPEYGYGGWEAIKNDQARIYSLRGPNGKPVATVELGKVVPEAPWELSQIKGPRNEPVKSIYADKVDDLIDKIEEQLGKLDDSPSDYDYTRMRYGEDSTRQAGKVDPRILARVGLVGAGATAGFALGGDTDEARMAGSFLGGLTGLLVPGGGRVLSRMRQSGAIDPEGNIISLLVKNGKLANKLETNEILARDAEWAKAAKAGDQRGFEQLYKTYFPEITRYVRKFLMKEGARAGLDPEDLAQQAFMTIYKNIDQYDPTQPFGAWARTVARNSAFDQLRSLQREKRLPAAESSMEATEGGQLLRAEENYFASAADSEDPANARNIYDRGAGADLADTPEGQAVRQQSEQLLLDAFAKMPEKVRDVITLTQLEQYTAAEAAEILKMPLGTVNVYVQRGKEILERSIRSDAKLSKFVEPSSDLVKLYHSTTEEFYNKIKKEGIRGFSPMEINETITKDLGIQLTDDLLDWLDDNYWLGDARSRTKRGPFFTTSKERTKEIRSESIAEGPAAIANSIGFYFENLGNTELANKAFAYEQSIRNSPVKTITVLLPKDKITGVFGDLPEDLSSFTGDIVSLGKVIPKNQRGEISPDLIKKLGLSAAGGLAAYAIADKEDLKKLPWKVGAGIVTGLILSGGTGSAIVKAADKGLGISSTRIKNHSEAIHTKAVNHFRKVLEETHQNFQKVDPFIKRYKQLPVDVQNVVSRAILSGDGQVIKRLLDHLGDQELINGYKSLRSSLDSLGDQLQNLNRFKKGKTEYFPRIVKDKEGLFKALQVKYGNEEVSTIQQALRDANNDSMRKQGRALNQAEESAIINQILFADKRAIQPGWTKARRIEEITPDLLQYYADPAESLHTYIRSAVEDINKAKFFGKYGVNMKKGQQEFIDTDRSVSNLIHNELVSGNLTEDGAREVADVLKSVFANKAPDKLVADAKNLAYAGLLGNFWSAATQMSDVIMQVYLQGMRPTLEAVARSATGKKYVDMRTFGLEDSITAEFANQARTNRYLNRIFKYSLFQGVDRFGKNVALNAAIAKARNMLQTESGQVKFANKYTTAFGDDLPKLMSELKSGKFGDLSRLYAFMELSRSQPVTRLEMSQWWLDSPNIGRSALVLKSFMLKQADLARRDGVNLIKQGKYVEGSRKLLELGIVLGLAGTASDVVKQFMTAGLDTLMGQESEGVNVSAADIPLNMLKTFGLTEYTRDRLFGVSKSEAKERRAEGDKRARSIKAEPVKAIVEYFTPPAKVFTDIAQQDPGMWRYIIPGFGPYVAELAKRADAEEREVASKRRKKKQEGL